MGKLNYNEVNALLKGMEYTFRKREKKSKSEQLNRQLQIRDKMREFVNNEKNKDKIFEINKEDGKLIFKKLEYRFKNDIKRNDLFEKLKS